MWQQPTSLFTDHYELTMLQARCAAGTADRRSVFEVFARRLPEGRRYGVVAGTGRMLEALEQFRFGADELDFLPSAARGGRADPGLAGRLPVHRRHPRLRRGRDATSRARRCCVVESTFAEAVRAGDARPVGAQPRLARSPSAASRMTARRRRPAAAWRWARGAPTRRRRWPRPGPRTSPGSPRTSNLEAGRRYGMPTDRAPPRTRSRCCTTTSGTRSRRRSPRWARAPRCWWTPTTWREAVRAAVEVAGPELGAVRLDSGDLVAAGRAGCAPSWTSWGERRPGSWSPPTWTSTRSPRWRPPRWTPTAWAPRW